MSLAGLYLLLYIEGSLYWDDMFALLPGKPLESAVVRKRNMFVVWRIE